MFEDQPDFPDQPARLELNSISAAYNGQPVLHDISFSVPHGDQVAVVGPNGAGKSTLFKAIVGLLPLSAGKIFIHGKPLGHHLDCVAYIPQREEVDWRFPVTVSDVVMMGRYGKFGWLKKPSIRDRQIVEAAMEQLGIADLAETAIGDLSGGQQQRIFLARSIAQEPHILLMDEPFTGVDAATQEATLQLLERLRERKVTVLVSTHDLSMASERFPHTLLINRRIIAYGAPADVFTHEHLVEAFGGQVFSAGGVFVIDQCCPPGEMEGGDL